MLDILLFACLGIIAGIFTGMIPGLHLNTISIIVFGLYFTYNPDPLLIAVFIVGMGITHSFLDFLPSIFLGAPDPSVALSVLPAHEMLFEGRGYEALILSVVGGLGGIFLLLLSFPLIIKGIPTFYNLIRPNIQFILILLMGFMIFIEKQRFAALSIFLLSGVFGLISLNSGLINQNFVMFPMLSGLFGFSTMILSYKTVSKIPKQDMNVEINRKMGIIGSVSGFIGGITAGMLPGFGSSQSAVLIQEFGRIKSKRTFITTLGGINTIDIILSIFALFLISNPRSGSAVIIGKILENITIKEVIIFLGVGLFSAGIAAILALKIGKYMGVFVQKINYRKLVLLVIFGLLLLTYLFTGIIGVFIALIGTSIGLLPQLIGVKKSLLLGCLILPTILYFSGFLFEVISVLGI